MHRFMLILAAGVLVVSFSPFLPQALAQDKKLANGSGRKLVLQKGHSDIAYNLAVSKDGKWLVTAGHDGRPILWETATGRQVRSFIGHRDLVNAMAFSEDGKWLATCSGEGMLELDLANDSVRLLDASTRLWNLATGQQVQGFQGHDRPVTCLALSRDGKLLATGGRDNTARLWDTATGKQIHVFHHPIKDGSVHGVAFSLDGKRLFTADDHVRTWDLATGKQVREFQAHNGEVKTEKEPVQTKEWSADGKTFVMREVIHERTRRTWINSLALCADGKELVTVGGDSQVRVWDATNGKPIRTFKIKSSYTSAVSADGKWLFTSSFSDKILQMWDLADGKEVRAFRVHHSDSHGLSVSQDGKFLFATDSEEGVNMSARMWDVATGKLIRTFQGMVEGVNSVSLSDDGKRLVVAGGTEYAHRDNAIQLWDLEAGKRTRMFKGHTRRVRSAMISGDGKQLVSGGDDDVARSWDVDTGKETNLFKKHSGNVLAVALSQDGKTLLAASGDYGLRKSEGPDGGFAARSFDLQTGEKLRIFDHGDTEAVLCVALSPDGKWLATGCYENKLQLWDMNTAKMVRAFPGHQHAVAAVTFSRDGQGLVSGSWDGTAKLWDTTTGKNVRTFKEHTGPVNSLALSRNGKWLVTGSLDQTVCLHDLATGRLIRVSKGHTLGVTSVALTANGKWLVSGSLDGTTRIWDVGTGKELCRLLTLRDGTWIVMDATGRFDSGTDAEIAGVHWVDGMETSPLRQREPGLLAKLLGRSE